MFRISVATSQLFVKRVKSTVSQVNVVCHSIDLTYCKSFCLEIFTGLYHVTRYRSWLFFISIILSINSQVNYEFGRFVTRI